MKKEQITMQITIVGTEDNMHTYEIMRSWAENGRKGLILGLYPTLSLDRCTEYDLSTMHIMNHAKDFGWSTVRIINLYSLVCEGKPETRKLLYDEDNLDYIEDLLEGPDIKEYDLVIATGSSLVKHMETIKIKLDILSMFCRKGLGNRLKYISVGTGDDLIGAHPLFLGLHYGKTKWKLKDYPTEEIITCLKDEMKQKVKSAEIIAVEKVAKDRNKRKIDSGREERKNVSKDKKQA